MYGVGGPQVGTEYVREGLDVGELNAWVLPEIEFPGSGSRWCRGLAHGPCRHFLFSPFFALLSTGLALAVTCCTPLLVQRECPVVRLSQLIVSQLHPVTFLLFRCVHLAPLEPLKLIFDFLMACCGKSVSWGKSGPTPSPDLEYITSLDLSSFLCKTDWKWMICKSPPHQSRIEDRCSLGLFVTVSALNSLSLMMCPIVPLSCEVERGLIGNTDCTTPVVVTGTLRASRLMVVTFWRK